MDSDQIEDMKLKINNFIWMHAPPEMTLEEAENAAINLLIALCPEANVGGSIQ